MARALKRPNNVASTFFNTVYLLPKKNLGSNMGQTCFLPQAPSNVGTLLGPRQSKSAAKVYPTENRMQSPLLFPKDRINTVCSRVLTKATKLFFNFFHATNVRDVSTKTVFRGLSRKPQSHSILSYSTVHQTLLLEIGTTGA